MKNTMRVFALVLAFALLLCGCGQPAPAELETTAATEPAITTEKALITALEETGNVTMGGDIALSSELVVNGRVLNGGGYTLTGPTYVEGNTATENAITLPGGTVENVIIKGAYRGIGDSRDNGANEDVRIKDVTVDSDVYVLNFGYGNGQGRMYVEGSSLLGWTSYTKFAEAQFTNCTFGWCESGANGNLRPYINTTLIGCKFEGKTEADGTVTPFNISFKSGTDGVLLVLEDCYVGEELITQENLSQLLSINLAGNTIEVRNS